VASLVRNRNIAVQVLVNLLFYVAYSFFWFGPVQEVIGWLYHHLLIYTRSPENRIRAVLDRGYDYSYLNYQLLKHGFRLSWFYLAAYFHQYWREEKKRVELAVANRELQLKMLKWHLNPEFYFKTIHHLREMAAVKPSSTSEPILQLARVMEYVIYEAKEKLIEVSKEVQFLGNYIRLRNQQTGNPVHFEMDVSGNPEHLKIAPLLLTGMIDKVSKEAAGAEKSDYALSLHFTGNLLQLSITGLFQHGRGPWLPQDDPIAMRLNEWYPEKHSIGYSPDTKTLKLEIKLDADR
jgi:hypothetical protein